MTGWRNKKTGVVHCHAIYLGRSSSQTGCGRVVLWDTETRGQLNRNYEYTDQLREGDKPCQWCLEQLKGRAQILQEWIQDAEAVA